MLPLTGAELSVVMLSLRAFKFYFNSVEFYGQCQFLISQSGFGALSPSLLFWLSANPAYGAAAYRFSDNQKRRQEQDFQTDTGI
jgi:hypothetical protein